MQQELSQSGSESRINLAVKIAAAAANTTTEMIDYMTAENIKYSCINFGFCLFRLFFFLLLFAWRTTATMATVCFLPCVSRARREDGAVFVCAFIAKAAAADAAIAIDVLVGALGMASASCELQTPKRTSNKVPHRR